MKYPDDFNTPAFPEGKHVAVSRFMGTLVMVLFFIIVCLCGMILWVKKTQDVSPFLISINSYGGRWTMIAHNDHKTQIPAYYVLQESLLNKFAKNWFTVSDNVLDNQARWAACEHSSEECRDNGGDNVDTCAISCACDALVFENFEKVVLPTYSEIVAEEPITWSVESVSIKPLDSMDSITHDGGMWQLIITVRAGIETIRFMGYASVGFDSIEYPKTMGYYIQDFNTYRMN